MYLLYLLVSLWNLSVHVFIKLIPSELIYFEGGACYIREIDQYMIQIDPSFAQTGNNLRLSLESQSSVSGTVYRVGSAQR